jgi:hypothetical protein
MTDTGLFLERQYKKGAGFLQEQSRLGPRAFLFPMSRLIFTIFILSLVYSQSYAILTVGEKTALAQILAGFPDLRNVTYMDRYETGYVDYGGPWSDDFEFLCSSSVSGFEYHGILCSNLGHIIGIRLYVFLFLIFILFPPISNDSID